MYLFATFLLLGGVGRIDIFSEVVFVLLKFWLEFGRCFSMFVFRFVVHTINLYIVVAIEGFLVVGLEFQRNTFDRLSISQMFHAF